MSKKYLVVCTDWLDNNMGFFYKDTWEDAVKFAERVRDNGFICIIYEDKPLKRYDPKGRYD